MKNVLCLVALLFPLLLKAQIISTFAGGGFGGSGGPATNASLSFPIGGAFDKRTGNYYFACSYSGHIVYKVAPSGIITAAAGTGVSGFSGDGMAATTAKLNTPEAVILDTFGNLYISDAGNNRIRKVDTNGIITTVAGNGMMSSTGDGGSATFASLFSPSDICFDKYFNLYIAEFFSSKIRKVTPAGIISTIAGTGVVGYSGDGTRADSCMLGKILGLASDSIGNIYIADNYASRVFKIDTLGYISTFAGTTAGAMYNGDNIPATAANVDPYRLLTDHSGNVYIADYHNYRVRKVDANGTIHTIAGNGIPGFSGDGGGPLPAQFNYPAGLAFDTCGKLYITDAGNGRVRIITPPSTINLSCIAHANPSDTACSGRMNNFTVADSGGGIQNSYQWYVNGAPVAALAGGKSYVYSYYAATGDSVRCVVTSTNPCSGSTATAFSNTIYTTILPTTTPTITATAPSFVNIGGTVTVNAVVTSAGSSYMIKWRKNGAPFDTTTTPVTTYMKTAGVDTITATVVSTDGGCYDTASIKVIVHDKTSVNDLSNGAFKAYPNPLHEILHIEGAIDPCQIRILTVMGQTVLQEDCKSASATINVSQMPVGIYILQIISEGAESTMLLFKE